MSGSPNPGYNAFKTAKAPRAPMVYVGSNDGMLHAFVDTPANGGKEAWAYVPKALFAGGDPNDTLHAPAPAFQLGALAFRRGGIPLYSHRFYVNATPRVWDIDFAYTNTATPPAGNDWRTILVGGLGAGGRAVYALDVTNPIAPPPPAGVGDTEATAAGKVLWEFTDANLGYVYDAPTLVKTKAYGWVALVASGYNNPGGKGYLYVLESGASSKSGQLLKKIPLPGDPGLTPTRPTSPPSGLHIQPAESLYAAGVRRRPQGQRLAFRPFHSDAAQWKAEKIATLKDATNKPQPITTGVRVEIDQNNNVDRYLFVGTGKLLDSAGSRRHVGHQQLLRDQGRHLDDTGTGPRDSLFPGQPHAIAGGSIAGLARLPSAAAGSRTAPTAASRSTRRLRRRERGGVRFLEALAGPVPRRAVVDAATRAISPPEIRCSWRAAEASSPASTSPAASRGWR